MLFRSQTQGHGSKNQYHVVGFAEVVITTYQLPGDNRISARYEGSTDCQATPPPPPPPPPLPPLSGATLTLNPSVAGPDVTGTTQTFTATLKNRAGAALTGYTISLNVTGANTASSGGMTNANGQTTLTYIGSNAGSDTAQVSTTDGTTTLQSNTAAVTWVTPVQAVSTTTIWARVFSSDSSGVFKATPDQAPLFSIPVPTINFNPPSGTVPGNTSGVTEYTRPMTDVTTDLNGNYTGTIVLQGNGYQAGVNLGPNRDETFFNAVFTGSFTVAAAGNASFNMFTDDGFILGIGNNATRVSGPLVGTYQATTAFDNLPTVGAYNIATAPTGNTITVNFPAAGSYPFELDYSEGICCQLVVQATMVTKTGTQGIPPTGSLTLTPNTVANQPAGGTQTFTVAAADAGGNALANVPVQLTITGANAQALRATTDSTGKATFTYTGTYAGMDTVQAIAWVSNLASYSAQVNLTWTNPPIQPPATPQTQTPGWIGSPAPQSTVTGLVPITLGQNITFSTGTVAYWPASNPQAVTTLASGVTGIGGTTLATLDTTTLPNGTYIIQLLGTDNTGHQLNSETLVTVAGENKPGRVTFSVTDLTVPVAGIPITIGRTYDSLNKGQSGDFGYGWSLSVSSKLTVDPATHDVTLTLPSGRRATFGFTPQSTGGVFGYLLTPGYTPEPGVYGSLTSDGCSLLAVSGGQYFCFPGGSYAPTTYTYTDPYGRVYVMGADGSLKSITDLNGNTLTYSATGITSSAAGAAVTFTRDSAGRITAVTDPTGNVYSYTYDPQGNLASVSFPGVTTPATYTYDSTHLLLKAIDPRGNTGATTTYDANGRLASVTDAVGNKTSYSYDLNANTTTITYPDGGIEVDTYDSFGDLLSQSDPLNRTTTFTYNSNHKLLTRTDALGHKTTYTYDSQGNQASVTDPLGHTTSAKYNAFGEPYSMTDQLGNVRTISYDASARPSSVSDSLGTAASYTYNSYGQPLTRTDGNGNMTTYTYDGYGNLLSQTDALKHTVSFTYDNLGRQLTATDAQGNITKYSYDALGHVLTVTDPLGHVTSMQYDANGNQTALIDALGRKTAYTYDADNRLTGTTYPDGSTSSVTLDFRGNPLQVTDQAGHVTLHVYDLAGEQTSVTTANGTGDAATTTYTYDAAGRRVQATDPLGQHTATAYDADDRPLSMTDPLGHANTITYDAAGRPTNLQDANGHTTTYTYDTRGQTTKTTYVDGSTATQSFDGMGNVLTATDQAGRTTTYTYDADGRVLSVSNPLNQTTSYTYDSNGNVVSVTDANNHVTTFAYDALGDQTKKTWPDNTSETFGYDAMGNLASHQLADGHTNTYSYDVLNRLSKVSYFDGTSVSYTYTPTGQQQAVVDARGTTTYAYDNQDRVTAITQPNGLSISYGYDAAGNRTGMTTAAGTTTYSYDSAGRLASVTDPTAGKVTFSYDGAGNQTQRALPNGIAVNYGYDALDRLTSVAETQGSNTLASYAYTLDPVGNRTKVTEADGTTVAWAYDNASRLTGETQTAPNGTVVSQTGYTYDSVGNRLTMTAGGQATNYTYNSRDQLTNTTTGNQSTQYSYDGRGSLTGVTTSGSGASSTTTYSWDAADRLAGVTLPNGASYSYSYDAAGRRVSQTTAGMTTNYLWDETSLFNDVVLEADSSGAPQASYMLGNGQLLAQTRGGTSSYDLPDGQNSVRMLTNSSGSITDTYRYDAFGNVVSSQGTTTNPYGYDGQRYDAATGLYQFRARSYDPATGRFLSADTASVSVTDPAGLNRYLYASSNPINVYDPTGYDPLDEEAMLYVNIEDKNVEAEKQLGLQEGYDTAFDTALTVALLAHLFEDLATVIYNRLNPPGTNPPPIELGAVGLGLGLWRSNGGVTNRVAALNAVPESAKGGLLWAFALKFYGILRTLLAGSGFRVVAGSGVSAPTRAAAGQLHEERYLIEEFYKNLLTMPNKSFPVIGVAQTTICGTCKNQWFGTPGLGNAITAGCVLDKERDIYVAAVGMKGVWLDEAGLNLELPQEPLGDCAYQLAS